MANDPQPRGATAEVVSLEEHARGVIDQRFQLGPWQVAGVALVTNRVVGNVADLRAPSLLLADAGTGYSWLTREGEASWN
jgi:hypothetical protein